ncbi:M55 family metallopeptidase [Gemmatimonas sp.]|uniref:M55 family metallopeptidase n=1 Tax=Gemmatimonas sp. TaxID=1962908 RepID=UPI0039836D51
MTTSPRHAMPRLALVSLAFLALVGEPAAAQPRPLKVFVSVDMEGLAGVVSGSDVGGTSGDYQYFRKIMAQEASAAVAGAFSAGATEVLVRDSHGAKQNILPGDLDPRAKLLRGASTGPKNMMEGIDSTFAAVVFIGYHARAGTPNAILAHTSNGNVVDFSINGRSLPEGGYNALVAGLYGVPVVFVAGDGAVVRQHRELLGNVDGLAVKEAISGAINGMSPATAQDAIRLGVERAVRARAKYRPFALTAPFAMVLKVAKDGKKFDGASNSANGEYTFTSPDLLLVLSAFNALK